MTKRVMMESPLERMADMRRMMIMALTAALLVGCGGSKDRSPMLHLDNGDVTEQALRKSIRSDPAWVEKCAQLEAYWGLGGRIDPDSPATADNLRATAILREECDRLLGTSQ